MRLKKLLGDLLIMSKAERNGSLVLLSVLLMLILIRFVIPNIGKDDQTYLNEIEEKIAQLESQKDSLEAVALNSSTSYSSISSNANKKSVVNTNPKTDAASSFECFSFDPNTETFTNLLKLGFPKKVANTLIRFRASGARFFRPDDLLKVYGVDSVLYTRLKPYISIAAITEIQKEPVKVADNCAPIKTIEINGADSVSWISLPGIGPVFARRICTFRTALGGFISIDQLGEVYNLPDETFQRIKPYLKIDTTKVEKINLNFADVAQLSKHPYCSYASACEIVNYRVKNGSYSTSQQLLSDSLLSPLQYTKIAPYLKVNK